MCLFDADDDVNAEESEAAEEALKLAASMIEAETDGWTRPRRSSVSAAQGICLH